jgi:hypothetical protein
MSSSSERGAAIPLICHPLQPYCCGAHCSHNLFFLTFSHAALLCRFAAYEGQAACVQLLLDSGVNANQELLMSCAVFQGHASVVQVLMSAGAVPLWLQSGPVCSACRLLRSGAQVAQKHVHVVVDNGRVAMLQAFIAAGVDVHASDERALLVASERALPAIAQCVPEKLCTFCLQVRMIAWTASDCCSHTAQTCTRAMTERSGGPCMCMAHAMRTA